MTGEFIGKFNRILIIRDKRIWVKTNGDINVFGCSKKDIKDITDHSPKAEFEIVKDVDEKKEMFRTSKIGNTTFFT